MWSFFEGPRLRRLVDSVFILNQLKAEKSISIQSIDNFLTNWVISCNKIAEENLETSRKYQSTSFINFDFKAQYYQFCLISSIFNAAKIVLSSGSQLESFDEKYKQIYSDGYSLAEKELVLPIIRKTEECEKPKGPWLWALRRIKKNPILEFYIPNLYREEWVKRNAPLYPLVDQTLIINHAGYFNVQERNISNTEEKFKNQHQHVVFDHIPDGIDFMIARYSVVLGTLEPRLQSILKFVDIVSSVTPSDTENFEYFVAMRSLAYRCIIGRTNVLFLDSAGRLFPPIIAEAYAPSFRLYFERFTNDKAMIVDQLLQEISVIMRDCSSSPVGVWLRSQFGGSTGGWATSR